MNVRMPNAFTPNEDGLNDVFKPIESGGSEVYGSLIIFNRWGEMVYESEEQPIWDGRILGENAPSEVYVFLLKIFCSGSIENLVGEVTLLR
jgi:gliding motility-associated-like protein